jgi:hypothetical protein
VIVVPRRAGSRSRARRCAGHLVADLVTGADPIVDPRPYHPDRFEASAWGKVGPMPKPWPEKPAARIRPGTPVTSPIAGTPSGVESEASAWGKVAEF